MKLSMKLLLILSSILFLIILFSCDEKSKVPVGIKKQVQETANPKSETMIGLLGQNEIVYGSYEIDSSDFLQYYDKIIEPPAIDLNVDLKDKSLFELVILRNEVLARKRYLFDDGIIRGYFNAKKWYQPIYWDENFKVDLTQEEFDFIANVKAQELIKLKENYLYQRGNKIANINNVLNFCQFEKVNDKLKSKLSQNGFAIVPAKWEQLFQLYEENDYSNIPNFVTTDLFLQLFHMYFSFILRDLEEHKMIPIMKSISEVLYKESTNPKLFNECPECMDLGYFNQSFYAIALKELTGKDYTVTKYKNGYKEEIKNIKDQMDGESKFLNEDYFKYSLFKVRGHYTKTKELSRYFKAMMWLQTATLCLDDDKRFSASILSAYLLNNRTYDNRKLIEIYKEAYDIIAFLVGESDNLSFLDICNILNTNKFKGKNISYVLSQRKMIKKELLKIQSGKNKIKPRIELTCHNKINFMPQRYLFDNSILSVLHDLGINDPPKREFPKGLDVFAVLGDKTAEDILLNEYKESKNWNGYKDSLNYLKKTIGSFNNWNSSVYNKWMESLVSIQKENENYPYFMKTNSWKRKNLNTMLASWTELKHDVILYGEQPSGAECGGEGPPPPTVFGYVEPNINFWGKAVELIKMTETKLKNYKLMTEFMQGKTDQIKELSEYLLNISNKELSNENLTLQDYETIKVIGATIEYLTLSLLEDTPDNWYSVKGPDKSVAVVADVFSGRQQCLEEAVGFANEIYVIVEIKGYLYLTRGAVFSYYEFLQNSQNRLTDEEWQKMLYKGNIPEIPIWLKNIITNTKPIKALTNYVYSSGC